MQHTQASQKGGGGEGSSRSEGRGRLRELSTSLYSSSTEGRRGRELAASWERREGNEGKAPYKGEKKKEYKRGETFHQSFYWLYIGPFPLRTLLLTSSLIL